MPKKLSLQNARKQVIEYMIYIITMVMTVALLLSFNNPQRKTASFCPCPGRNTKAGRPYQQRIRHSLRIEKHSDLLKMDNEKLYNQRMTLRH